MAAGKTTLAKKLSKLLKINHLNIDMLKDEYFKKLGYKLKDANKALKDDGVRGFYNYCKQYELTTLKNYFKNKNCVFDIGAGFIVYEDLNHKKEIFNLLSNFRNKFLILPHEDSKISYDILQDRFLKRYKYDPELEKIMCSTPEYDLNLNFLDFFYKYKDIFTTIYTYQRSINNLAKEIVLLSVKR